MSKSRTVINFDTIYVNNYNKVYSELNNKVISQLKKPTKHTLLFKRNSILKTLNDDFKAMTMKRLGSSSYLPDKYTESLLNNFKHQINNYVESKITNFIVDHLKNIKEAFKDSENSIPSNIKMSPKQTVEFIAKYEALETFLYRLYTIEKDDSIEICAKKLSIEGYNKPTNADKKENEANNSESNYSDAIMAAALKREFTTARQVLAIKFLFQFAGIKENEYDKTELARFIRFLTGKELGNDKIQNTGIYKKIKNPYKDKDSEKKEDLKYIRAYFQNLNLTKIVNLINEEIDNDK